MDVMRRRARRLQPKKGRDERATRVGIRNASPNRDESKYQSLPGEEEIAVDVGDHDFLRLLRLFKNSLNSRRSGYTTVQESGV